MKRNHTPQRRDAKEALNSTPVHPPRTGELQGRETDNLRVKPWSRNIKVDYAAAPPGRAIGRGQKLVSNAKLRIAEPYACGALNSTPVHPLDKGVTPCEPRPTHRVRCAPWTTSGGSKRSPPRVQSSMSPTDMQVAHYYARNTATPCVRAHPPNRANNDVGSCSEGYLRQLHALAVSGTTLCRACRSLTTIPNDPRQ